MSFTPRKPSIQRIEQTETIRVSTQDTKILNKNGKICVACKMYFAYLKPVEKLCLQCNKSK